MHPALANLFQNGNERVFTFIMNIKTSHRSPYDYALHSIYTTTPLRKQRMRAAAHMLSLQVVTIFVYKTLLLSARTPAGACFPPSHLYWKTKYLEEKCPHVFLCKTWTIEENLRGKILDFIRSSHFCGIWLNLYTTFKLLSTVKTQEEPL